MEKRRIAPVPALPRSLYNAAMPQTFSNYINGQWVPSHTAKTFTVYNPAHHREAVATFQDSDAADMKTAVDAAAAAYKSWSRTPAPKRAGILRKAGELLAKRREEAATLLTREEGKPIGESRGEIDRGVGLLDFYAGQGALLNGETFPSTVDGRFLYTMRVPLGPVGLITPWNFPSAIPIWKAAPALVCGNTVVLKPAEQAPASAVLVAEVLHEAGLPPGVFNLVTGSAPAGQALVADERIRAISFTGSVEVGRAIMRKAGERLIRIGLEMGGKNPYIVLEDADLDRAVEDTITGAFGAAGHKCTASSRALVVEKIYDAFVEKLVERTSELRIGDGLDAQTQVCPMLDETLLNKTLQYIEIGTREGAKLRVGGQRMTGGGFDEGWYVSPAVFTGVTREMRIAREEIFGPVVAVMKVKDFDEAIEIANDVEYGLAAGIATRSLGKSLEFARRIDAGLIHVNNPTAGVELQLPFGGLKNSTSGYREMGKSALDFYSQIKTVYVDG